MDWRDTFDYGDAFEYEAWEEYPDINYDYDFWTMKDGTQIHVSDMSKSHLINTIRLLEEGDNPYAEGYIRVMKAELKSRSSAQDAINDFK